MGHILEPPGADWVGRVLDGRYQVESVIGMGGMGVTYLASDRRQFGRNVAIKLPQEDVLATRSFRERFSQEIKQLIAREHPHIVKLYDSGDVDGVPYAVLQYLPGGSLRARLQEKGSVLTAIEVLQWLPAIAEALDFIHAKVLHRDVKPENILFDGEGHAYLVDFGIAKVFADPMLVTKTGAILGSPHYMAPEVATGKRLTASYDQYALAVVVYEAMSGQWPHEGSVDDFAYLVQKLTQPPRSLRRMNVRVPSGAADAVMRALSTDPRHRFESCQQFASAFHQGAKGGGVNRRIFPTARTFAAASVTVLAVGLAWNYVSQNRRDEPAPIATLANPSTGGDRALNPSPEVEVAGQSAIDLKWRDYQTKMELMHRAILDEERAPRSEPSQKAARWRAFLSQFRADNPSSAADDALRGSARERLQEWERQTRARSEDTTRSKADVTRPDVPRSAPVQAAPQPAPGPAAVESKPSVERDAGPVVQPERGREKADGTRELLLQASQSFDRADYPGAARTYEAVLALDPSSVAARQGLDRSRRAQDAEERILRRLTEPN